MCAIIISIFVVLNLQNLIGGFIPAEFLAMGCGVGQISGTVYYVKT